MYSKEDKQKKQPKNCKGKTLLKEIYRNGNNIHLNGKENIKVWDYKSASGSSVNIKSRRTSRSYATVPMFAPS